MKKFSKIMLSVAAVSAMTAAMAVSASAMTPSYDNGNVTLSDVGDTGASQTLLILNKTGLSTVAEEDIVQIDQKDNGDKFAVVPVGELDNGTYEVRIGGSNGQLQTITFTVGNDVKPTHKVLIGDIDGDGEVTSGDASELLSVVAEESTDTLSSDKKIAAQCDSDDDEITSGDAAEILIYCAEESHDRVNTQVDVED